METIKYSAQSLLSIINDILDFSKVDSGKLDFECTEFNLDAELSALHRAFHVVAAAKQVDLLMRPPENLRYNLMGDVSRVRQILTNLVANATKFTDDGYIQTVVEIEKETETEVELIFKVMDSGIGIPPEAIGRIFAEFSQADSSMSRRYGGTGLGLTICKRLVELMGGEIGVESQQGIGSTFWFRLKFPKGAPRETAPQDGETAFAASDRQEPLGPLRILVAEDNHVNQMLINAMLEKFGCQSVVASNGVEALWLAENEKFDLILMDCQMPEMDGYEATGALRGKSDPRLSMMPIIALTANAIKGDREKCIAAGMNDYVSKPVDETALYRAIQALIGHSRAESTSNRIEEPNL